MNRRPQAPTNECKFEYALPVEDRTWMTIDKETGWSKGFGFVSYGTVEEADAAMQAVHGSWVANREMKVEKAHN